MNIFDWTAVSIGLLCVVAGVGLALNGTAILEAVAISSCGSFLAGMIIGAVIGSLLHDR